MSAFKFNCPSCDAKMAAETEHIGLEIDCPHCSSKIKVPAPVVVEKEPAEEQKPEPIQEKKESSAPSKQPEKPAAKARPEPAASVEDAPDTDDPPPSNFGLEPLAEEQVASLSTEFKMKLVGEVREIISDESHWVKGRDAAGKQVICAKKDGETIVSLPPDSEEATHYSVIGAFLHVMSQHHVMVTADGRSRMLSTEIPDAADRVKGIGGTGAQRQPGHKATDPLTLEHGECVQLLDELDKMYNEMLDIRIAAAKPKEGGKSSLGPLVDLLTKKDDDGEKVPYDAADLGLTLLKTLESVEERLQIAEGQIDALTRQIDMLRKAAEE